MCSSHEDSTKNAIHLDSSLPAWRRAYLARPPKERAASKGRGESAALALRRDYAERPAAIPIAVCLWTLAIVRRLLKKEHGVEMSKSGVSRMLKHLG